MAKPYKKYKENCTKVVTLASGSVVCVCMQICVHACMCLFMCLCVCVCVGGYLQEAAHRIAFNKYHINYCILNYQL